MSDMWEDRFVCRDVVDPGQLLAHPANSRIHTLSQQKSMASVLGRVGWVGDVKVNKNTGKILDGHMRAKMAVTAGELVPVSFYDLTDEEERVVLATYDALGTRAVVDTAMYDDLVRSIPDQDESMRALFDSVQADWDRTKREKPPTEEIPPGDLDDLVWGMVGWSETKVKATADEIRSLTEAHMQYRAGNNGSDKGFVAWLMSHVD